MKWARIENGVVKEVTDIDPKGRFVAEIEQQFVSCSDDVVPGWLYDGKVFNPPVVAPPTKDQLLAQLDFEYQLQFDALKLAWAAAQLDGNTSLAAELQAEYQALKVEYQTAREAILNG